MDNTKGFIEIKVKHVEDWNIEVTARGLVKDGVFDGEYKYNGFTYGVIFPLTINNNSQLKQIKMNVENFIWTLGLSDVADTIHKHPKSGSDYSLRTLLEKFNRKVKAEHELEKKSFIQAITDPENQPNQYGIQLH